MQVIEQPMELRLVVLSGDPQQGSSIVVPHLPFIIGRNADCQLRPSSLLVSRQHCALVQRSGKLMVEDLCSRNGTVVNNRRIEGTVELHEGDELRVGPLVLRLWNCPPCQQEVK